MMQRYLPGNYASAAQADAMQVEQAKLLYAGLPAAIVINTLLALILVSIQSAVIAESRLFAWLAVIGAILLARSALAAAWTHNGPGGVNNAACWIRRFRIGVIATGVVWGLGVAFLFPADDELHQVFLAFVLAGLSAGAITSLAVDRVSTIGFLAPTLLPLVARFGMEGDAVSLAMGAMVVVFLFAIAANAARVGSSLRENFLLRINAVEQEQVLRQSEARLLQAQRSARIGYWELDLTINKLYWSDEIYRIFEIDRSTFGACYEAFLNAIHPDDRDKVSKAYTDSLANRQPYDIVHRLRFADGRIKFVHERCETDFNAEGKAIRSLGTVQDVTEQQLAEKKLLESEKRYRLLFESSRDALMTLAPPSWKFTSANRSTLQMFGAVSDAEFTGLSPWDISPQWQPGRLSSSEKARQMIAIALREGSNFFEWTHKRGDGSAFPTEVLLSRLDLNGQTYLQATVRDITERKRLEKEILEQRNDMDALQKAQIAAQTAAAIAHDLNQPLLAIASYCEAALMLLNVENPNLGKLREAVEGGKRQALRAGQSIHQLLDYLSMKEFPVDSFDLNRKIIDVLDVVKSEHELQFHTELQLEDGLPFVRANRTHVSKVLFNLLRNGVEAMQEAGVPLPAMTVTVRTVMDKRVAQVTIRDNGPGIKKDVFPRLFEPLFTTKAGGIGMGLAISRSLVEMNGGQLWVDPQEGPGAIFHLTLPFAP
jgi:PAS domain S-box-containing protein